MSGTAVSFNSFSLQTANILTATIDHDTSPDKNAIDYEIAHSNRNVIPYVNYPRRNVTLTGMIVPTNPGDIEETDALIDTFKGYFTALKANLDVGYRGGTRRYVGTARPAPIIDRPHGLGYARFSVTLVCQPFGSDITETSALSATGRTSASYTDAIDIGGTAPVQQIKATIVYNSVSGLGAVSLGNTANGQQITVTRTWTAGEELVIDVANRNVTVDGVAVDFSGGWPEFPAGTNGIFYSDTMSSRNFDIDITYYKRWA